MSDQTTGVKLNAKLSIFFILNMLMPLTVNVDGVDSKGVWKEQFLNLAPGTHRLVVSWKLYWFLPVQKGELAVTVQQGEVVPVRYKVRWLFFLPGKLYVETAGS
jgi:hypothetical protein